MARPTRVRPDESWWLVSADGTRRRIDAGGVTMGRSASADLVLASERASRMQAIVVLSPEGAQLVQLGRGKTRVNGELVEHERALANGDVVELPGLSLTATRETEPIGARAHGWVIQRDDGSLYGITRSPFRIGGSEDDDLWLDGWLPHAAELRIVDGALEVRGEVALDGHTLADWTALHAGGVLSHGEDRITIASGGSIAATATVQGSRGGGGMRVEVRLEFLPRGGRLCLRSAESETLVYLPDKRCDLMALLLAPPEPLRAGDFVEDEALLGRIWGKELKARTDVNVLVHRLRKDLERAGLDASWVERQKGGGATRFLLLPGTKVTLV